MAVAGLAAVGVAVGAPGAAVGASSPGTVDPVAASVISPNPPGSVDGRDAQGRIVGHADALADVLVTPVGGDEIRQRLASVQHRNDEATAAVSSHTAAIERSTGELLVAQADLRSASDQLAPVSGRRDVVAEDLRAITISRFVDNTDDLDGLDVGASLDRVVEHRRVTTISADVAATLRTRMADLDRRVARRKSHDQRLIGDGVRDVRLQGLEALAAEARQLHAGLFA